MPRKKIAEKIARLRHRKYAGMFDDLVAFTGLSAEAVFGLVSKSSSKSPKELKFVSPKGAAEMELFYRCSREYLFLNAFRGVSQLLIRSYKNGLVKEPVLDFGSGMGSDSVWLARQGCGVSYHEIGIIQREFMNFRCWKNDFRIDILVPYVDGKYDSLGCVEREQKYGTLFLRDVLEHIPGYVEVARRLVACLRPGGTIVEHTPFNERGKDGEWARHNELHHEAVMPLKKMFRELGVKPVKHGVWRKNV